MKLRHCWLNLVTCIITTAAVSLFLRTALSRHDAGLAPDAAVEATAAAGGRDREARSSSAPNLSLRQPLAGKERRSLIERRLKTVSGIASSLDRARALLGLVGEFDAGDFALALDACAPGENELPGGEFETILEEWSHRDPLAALIWAGDDFGRKAQVLATWSQADPEAALQWAREDSAGDSHAGLVGSVIASIAKSDPDLAVKHLAGLPEETRQGTLRNIVNAGDAASARAVVGWIATIEDPAERAEVAKNTYEHWDTYDTVEQKYALFEAYPETLAGKPVQNLFYCWMISDPVGARAALDRLSPGDLRSEVMRGVISGLFGTSDRNGLMDTIAAYRDEVDDGMLGELITSHDSTDPAFTLQQAGLIQDSTVREHTVAVLLERWADKQPDAAREWMDGNAVSAGVLEQFEKISTRPEDQTEVRLLEALSR